MTSYTNLLSDLRLEVRESSASAWTDAQLAKYISRAEQWLATTLSSYKNSGRFEYEDSLTLAANTETMDLTSSTFTKADTAGIITGIKHVDMLVSGQRWYPVPEVQEGDQNTFRTPTSLTAPTMVPTYFLRGDNIHFLPVSTQARTLRVAYNWMPAVKGTGGTAETPDQYDLDLLTRAAYDALATLGLEEVAFEKKYATRLAEIEDFEVNRARKGKTERVKFVSSRSLFPMR